MPSRTDLYSPPEDSEREVAGLSQQLEEILES